MGTVDEAAELSCAQAAKSTPIDPVESAGLLGNNTTSSSNRQRSGCRKEIPLAKSIPTKPIDRSAITGRFVTGGYAARHPRTTEHEHVPVSNPKK